MEKGALCPACGRKGMPVGLHTVLRLVLGDRMGPAGSGNYRFCATPDCPAVYYDNESSIIFYKDDLAVRVGCKETEPPIPLCYCFNVTEEDIGDEIRKMGRSTASRRIRAEVQAGCCDCEVKNPSGRCCLRQVAEVEKREGERREFREPDKMKFL